ncbi:MAG: tyrosine-type recombinase/integrase, partial [Dehalococcoidia bacterium]|nr:tyrosine-type recombinase/integrase [Dehalococcoidia bacterium]
VVQHTISRTCQRLGIKPLSPHGLRHLHASLLLAKGLPVTAVSQRLGHANAAITMTVYAHALKSQDDEAARAIQAVLERA